MIDLDLPTGEGWATAKQIDLVLGHLAARPQITVDLMEWIQRNCGGGKKSTLTEVAARDVLASMSWLGLVICTGGHWGLPQAGNNGAAPLLELLSHVQQDTLSEDASLLYSVLMSAVGGERGEEAGP